MIPNIQQCFDCKMQETFSASIALGVGNELFSLIALEVSQHGQILVRLIQTLPDHFRPGH